MGKTLNAIAGIFGLVILWVFYYFTLPTFSIAYCDGYIFIAMLIVLAMLYISMCTSKDKSINLTLFLITLAIALVILIVGIFAGTPFFTANTRYQLLGTPEKVEYEQMVKQIDTAQIPIVDEELARKQADKKIGEDISLGSRIKLGNAAIQDVDGEIFWIFTLEHSDWIKWWSNRTTPGYIKVSASNPNKVEFVTELDGEKMQIRYQESACFSNNIERYIRFHGYANKGLTEYTFEIDDNGRPYYVVTTYENRVIWGAPEATGVVIVDVQTGEINWYSINSAPEWVDIIQPKEFIENQIDYQGEFVHGFWNLSDKDKIKKTDLTLTVYSEDNCYYFTGMTSVGGDDSCVGFIMVNTRNKKSYMCEMSGATENAAMKSAEGLVSDFGYKAIEPLPINVNGIPTYITALKDEEKLIKAYALVNIANYNISAKGSTIAEAERAYLQAMANSGVTYVATDEAFGYTYEGIVERISSVVEAGSTQYYMILEGESNKIFTASYTISDELSITREGDTVQVSYIDDKNGTVNIIKFDNIAFASQISEKQERRNKMDEGTSELESDKNNIINVNPEENEEKWNSLTDEEKAKLMEELLKEN